MFYGISSLKFFWDNSLEDVYTYPDYIIFKGNHDHFHNHDHNSLRVDLNPRKTSKL